MIKSALIWTRARRRLCNFSGENTNTTKEIFFGGVCCRRQLAKPPSEREGDRDSGGRSLRDFGVLINFIVTRSPSVAFGASSLPEGAFVRHTSADSGFGLLPDRAWTATRYACPGRKRRESIIDFQPSLEKFSPNELLISNINVL